MLWWKYPFPEAVRIDFKLKSPHRETPMSSDSKYSVARQQLLSLLAKSRLDEIQAHWNKLSIQSDYRFLKKPEVGMVMVRAQADEVGQQFNMGEMTMTRCVIQLESEELGFGHCAGRDKAKAEQIAVIDACFQQQGYQALIHEQLVMPLETLLAEQRRQQAQKVTASKVNFFTMVRGE